jgi:hypothetical protein
MAYQIIIRKRFTYKVQKVLAYLENKWSQKAAADFLFKIDRRIELLTKTTSSWSSFVQNKRYKRFIDHPP